MINLTEHEIYPANKCFKKMPRIVCIVAIICRIHTTSESLKAKKYRYFSAF